MSLTNPGDGPAILRIVKQLNIGEKEITKLVGLRPTDRDRAMQLFRGGNVISKSVKVTTGKIRSNGEPVWIIMGDVVASQRSRVYSVRVVFSQVGARC